MSDLVLKYRAPRIAAELTGHFTHKINVAVATPEPTWWHQQPDDSELGPMCALGFAWPVPNPEGPSAMIFAFSPELINDQTQDLTDDEVDDYIAAIKWYGDMHIILSDDDDDPRSRHRQIMESMDCDLPEARRLLQEQVELLEVRKEIDGLEAGP